MSNVKGKYGVPPMLRHVPNICVCPLYFALFPWFWDAYAGTDSKRCYDAPLRYWTWPRELLRGRNGQYDQRHVVTTCERSHDASHRDKCDPTPSPPDPRRRYEHENHCLLCLVVDSDGCVAGAEPQAIIDTDFGAPGKPFEAIAAARGVRITGRLPDGWSDNSEWKSNVVAEYKPMSEGGREFLRVEQASGDGLQFVHRLAPAGRRQCLLSPDVDGSQPYGRESGDSRCRATVQHPDFVHSRHRRPMARLLLRPFDSLRSGRRPGCLSIWREMAGWTWQSSKW